MASVRNKDTTPELAVRKELFRRGYRFRVSYKKLPGRPDIALVSRKCAMFIHGCFWHSHSCAKGKRPGTNRLFWNTKLDKNIERDRRAQAAIKKMGWRVYVIWECDIRKRGIDKVLKAFPEKFSKNAPSMLSRGDKRKKVTSKKSS